MPREVVFIFAVALCLFAMQSVGTWLQLRDYQKAVCRVRRLGNVGIGQKKGFFGHIVLIACTDDGIITAVEVMEGMTIAARFRNRTQLEKRELVGAHIDDFIAYIENFEPRKKHFYRGFLQALEALESRLYPAAYAACKDAEKDAADKISERKRTKLPVKMMCSAK